MVTGPSVELRFYAGQLLHTLQAYLSVKLVAARFIKEGLHLRQEARLPLNVPELSLLR